MQVGEFYSEDRSPYSWVLVLLGVWALAILLRAVISYVLFPSWVDLTPGRVIGYWLLQTPLRRIAPDVRFFCLYIPDCITVSCAGAIVGTVFFSHWRQLALAFALAFVVVSHAAGGFPTRYLLGSIREGDWDRTIKYGVFTAAILAHLFLGAWTGARFFAKRLPEGGHCVRCGYNLRGLPRNVCPECGERFVPNMNHGCNPDNRGGESAKWWVVPSSVSTTSLYRFIAAGILLALFYACDWTPFQVLLRAHLQWFFGAVGLAVQQANYDGIPTIRVEEHFCKLTPHCTSLDLALILAPFVWAARSSALRNILRLGALGVAVFGVNLVRLGIAIYLYVLGFSWAYTHDVPYVLLYSIVLMVVIRTAIRQDGQELGEGGRKRCRQVGQVVELP